MKEGGPIAFYEIAAATLPLLLLSGIVLERLSPPKGDGDGEGIRRPEDWPERAVGFVEKALAWLNQPPTPTEHPPLPEASTAQGVRPMKPWLQRKAAKVLGWLVSQRHPMLTIFVAIALPFFGAWVIFAEVLALEAVASGAPSPVTPWIVGPTVVAALICVVVAVWVPWLIGVGRALRKAHQRHWLAWTVAPPFFVVLVLGLVFFLPTLRPTLTHLMSSLTSHETSSPSERVWLEHLVATSDYRIDRLEAEAATGLAAKTRAEAHEEAQHQVQESECVALRDLIEAEEHGNGKRSLPAACLGD
jgi:hypothetical protein